MKAFLRAFVVLAALLAASAALLAYSIARRGISTRADPSRIEELLARGMRRMATPASVRTLTNPLEPTDGVLEDGLAHFADHCAVCHATDGGGDTRIGRGLYPPVPDLRGAATQALSDGELFSIIENGIRMTGMPGWGNGTADGERGSWTLVHFIRRLPNLTEEDIARLEELTPRTSDEWREADEIRRFLRGEDVKDEKATRTPHKHEGSEL